MNDELISNMLGFVLGLFLALGIILAVECYETEKQTESVNCNCRCCLESEAEE